MSIAYSPDGQFIASRSHCMTVRIWNLIDGKEIQKLEEHQDWTKSVAYSQDSKYITR